MALMFKLKIDYDWISESANIKVLYAFKKYFNLGDRLKYILCDNSYILVPEYTDDGCILLNCKLEYSHIHRKVIPIVPEYTDDGSMLLNCKSKYSHIHRKHRKVIPIVPNSNIYITKYKSFILEIDTDFNYKILGLPVLLDFKDNVNNLEEINKDIESSPLAFTDIKLINTNVLERKLYKFVYNDRTTEISPLLYAYYYSEYRDSPKTNTRIKSSPNDYKVTSFKFNQIYDRGVHVKNTLIDILEYKQKIKINDWYSEIKYDPFTNTIKEFLYIVSSGKYFNNDSFSFQNKLEFINKYMESESVHPKKKTDESFDNIDDLKSIDWSKIL